MKISLLIFSINEVKEVISLAMQLHRTVDEIVVIDSSTKKNFKELELEKKDKELYKMRLFHTVALGYAEPYRSYGISKCKGDWILLLDTDERLSIHLRLSLRRLLEKANFNVLKVKRYEHATAKGAKSKYYTWQVRLFRKGSVEFLGLTHETPMMIGKVKKLRSKTEYIDHLDELRHQRSYNKMDIFSPAPMPLLIARDLAIGSMNGEMSLSYLKDTIRSHLSLAKEREADPSIAKIGEIITHKGIIKYLELDSEATIKKLNKKYVDKKQGIGLLINLLKDKYHGKYP